MKIRIDYITNSSSGCYICKTDIPIEEVEKYLHQMIDFYNAFMNQNLAYDQVFDGPCEINEDTIKTIMSYRSGYYEVYPNVIGGADAATEKDMIEKHNNIVIFSASDNSIPGCFGDLLWEKFKGEYLHFG